MKTLKGFGILSLTAVLVCGLTLLTGCQKASEKAAEKMMEKAIAKATGGKANVDIKEARWRSRPRTARPSFRPAARNGRPT